MSFVMRSELLGELRKRKLSPKLAEYFNRAGQSASQDHENHDVIVRNALGHATRYAFDERGFVGGVITPMGRRFALTSMPDGSIQSASNPGGRRYIFEYRQGMVSRLLRDSQELFMLGYDDRHRLSSITYYDKTATNLTYATETRIGSVTNRLGHTEALEYDNCGNVIAVINGRGNRTTFVYGKWNRPDTATFPDGSQQSYRYDSLGRVSLIQNNSDPMVHVRYDASGNPDEFRYSDGRTLRFEYNGQGQPLKASDQDNLIEYQYDENHRIVVEQQNAFAVRYTYDAEGNPLTLTYPSGGTVTFEYDSDGRLSSFVDWNGGINRFSYASHDSGYRLENSYGLDLTTSETTAGLPASYVVNHRNRAVFWHEFQYDAEDRIVAESDSSFGRRQFTYDAEGQLLASGAFGPARAEWFQYDGAGNRTFSTGSAATFDVMNQLMTEGGLPCTYDSRGNLTVCFARGGQWRLSYNEQNLLVGATGPHGQNVRYSYDAFGRRLSKRVKDGQNLIECMYIWSGEHLIAEISKLNGRTQVQEFLYRPGTYTPLATRIDGRIFSYLCDHRGAPISIIDEAGHVVWSATYEAFGRACSVNTSVSNPLRFPGQFYDEETGFHYNRFRYYSPQLGRYLSRDPLSFVSGVNPYIYVGNDPVNRNDPLGLWWKAALSVLAGVAAAAAVVLTAPVSLPALAIAAGAAAIGVGVAVGLNKALNLKEFSASCFLKAFGLGFVEGAVLTGAIIGACLLFPAAATAIVVTASAVGIYSMLQEHFGWHLFPWEKGSKSYFDMTPAEQNKSLGSLAGFFAGASTVGAVANQYVVPRTAVPINPEETSKTPELSETAPNDSQPPVEKPGPKLFPNQKPESLQAELNEATELGVKPMEPDPSNPEFANIANEGTIKWVVTQDGELLVIPKSVDGVELSHAVIADGEPVQAAGEAEISVVDGQAQGIEINTHSGHYMYGTSAADNAAALGIGQQAFGQYGISFPSAKPGP